MLIARLAAEPETRFADRTAWLAHLDRLGFAALTVTPEPADRFAGHRFASASGRRLRDMREARPDPVRVATEGASWGSVQSHEAPSHEYPCDAVGAER